MSKDQAQRPVGTRRIRSWIAGLCLFFFCGALTLPTTSRAADPQAVFGVFPYLSPKRISADFITLRNALQKAADRPLALRTAPSYGAFSADTIAGKYDVVFTPPHYAVAAEQEAGFLRIAMTQYQIRGAIIVRDDAPVRAVADLRGKVVAVPPRDSLVYLLAMGTLHHNGLEPGRDTNLEIYDTNENALAAFLRGETDAGIVGKLMLTRIPERNALRIIGETEAMPGFMVMAHPRGPQETVEKWRATLLGFGETSEGKTYFQATGHVAFNPIDDAAMASLERHLRSMSR